MLVNCEICWKVKELSKLVKTHLQQGKIFNAANFEVQKYNQKEPRVNSAYLRKHLPKIKDGACVISIKKW